MVHQVNLMRKRLNLKVRKGACVFIPYFDGMGQHPQVLKAMRAVFPAGTPFLPVGGITPTTMGAYHAAGAAGFGLGSALYRPGMTAAEVAANAGAFVAAWGELRQQGKS